MAWAKVLGSSIFSWYIGFWCLVVIIFNHQYLKTPQKKWFFITDNITELIFILIGAGLLIQTLALLTNFPSKRNIEKKKPLVSLSLVFGTTIFLLIKLFEKMGGNISSWYIWNPPSLTLFLISIYIFLGWAFWGCIC